MRWFIILICMPLLGFGATIEKSQAEETAAASQFIEFFVGACLRGLPDIDRMKAAARVMNWKPLEGDVAAMIAPADKQSDWQGWIVPTEDEFFMFGVSEGALDDHKILTCVASVREMDQEKLVRELQAVLDLRLIADEAEALQRARGWETNIDGQNLIVNLTTLANSRMSPATLAGVVID